MEEMHQQKLEQMIKSADGSVGLLHTITMPTPWMGGAQVLEKEEEDARLLDRCEAKRREWAKHWQCDEDVQNAEEALPRQKECHLEEVSRLYEGKTGVGCVTASTLRSPWTDKRNKRKNRGVFGEGGAEWKMAATSLYDQVFPDSAECHE